MKRKLTREAYKAQRREAKGRERAYAALSIKFDLDQVHWRHKSQLQKYLRSALELMTPDWFNSSTKYTGGHERFCFMASFVLFSIKNPLEEYYRIEVGQSSKDRNSTTLVRAIAIDRWKSYYGTLLGLGIDVGGKQLYLTRHALDRVQERLCNSLQSAYGLLINNVEYTYATNRDSTGLAVTFNGRVVGVFPVEELDGRVVVKTFLDASMIDGWSSTIDMNVRIHSKIVGAIKPPPCVRVSGSVLVDGMVVVENGQL